MGAAREGHERRRTRQTRLATIMAETVIEMIDKYDVHGFVMHSNRSCKPYSFGQIDIMNIVREKAGIPVLMIEADMVDPRSFSQSQIETRIDAFMEMLKLQR